MRIKRILSLLLAMALAFSLCAPALAVPVDELKSDTVLTRGTVGGRSGIFVEWKVSTGSTAIVTANISYAYDTNVFELVDNTGTAVAFPTDDPPKQNSAQLVSGGSATWDFADDLYLKKSETTGLVAFVRSAFNHSFTASEFTTLGKFFLAYKEGKSLNDVTVAVLRMASPAEADILGQSSVVGMGDSSFNEYKSGTTDSSDTLGWAANLTFAKDFTFATPVTVITSQKIHAFKSSTDDSDTPVVGEHLPSNISSDLDVKYQGAVWLKWYEGPTATGIALDASSTIAKASTVYTAQITQSLNDTAVFSSELNGITNEYGYKLTLSADRKTLTAVKTFGPTAESIHSNWASDWTFNEQNHWHKCLTEGCSEVKDFGSHIYNVENKNDSYKKKNATCTTGAEYYYSCICGAKSTTETFFDTTLAPSNHTGTNDKYVSVDANYHQQKWTCCDANAGSPTSHRWDNGKCTFCNYQCLHPETTVINRKDPNHNTQESGYTGDTKCTVCGKIIANGQTIPADQHTLKWTHDADNTKHWQRCTVPGCSYTTNEGPHAVGSTGTAATCINKATCGTCGEQFGNVDLTNHVGETEVKNKKDATCTEKGYTGDTCCKSCGNVITAGSEISALGHLDPIYVERDGQEDSLVKYADFKCSRCNEIVLDPIKGTPSIRATLNLDVFLKCTKAADSGEFDKNKHEKFFFYQVIKGENDSDINKVGFPLFTGDFSHRLNQQYTLVSGKGTNDNEALFNMRLPQREGDAWTVKMAQPDPAPTGWTVDDTEYKVYFDNDCTELVIMKKVEKQIEQNPTTDAGTSTDPTEPVPPTDPQFEFVRLEGTDAEIVFNNTFKVEKKDDPTPPTPTPVIPEGPKHTNRRYPAKPAASTDTKKPDGVNSARTFDAGVALYVGMSVLSLTGTALVIGKKKEF